MSDRQPQIPRRSLLGLVPALLLASEARADPAALLAQSVYDRPNGKDLTLSSVMYLTEGGRAPRVRRLVSYRLDRGGGQSAYLVRFLAPKDIAGVGLLSLTKGDGSAEQSLYLPELDRTRRISGDRKGGRFVGSDLYFEDLQERKPDRDRHRIVGREDVGGISCDMLESRSIDPDDSVYARRQSWIDRQTNMPLRVDYFERDDGSPNKRWLMVERQLIQGYWTVMTSTMTDLGQGTETRLSVEAARYDRRLPVRLFTAQALADETLEAEYRL